jgi:pSer/pThr/pTyr-binding forkhead associated (FHA) protein
MVEIEIVRDGQRRTVRLRGGAYVLGRHEACDIVLEDKGVSRRHARLLVDGDDVVVEDLGSGNGTLLGGVAISGPVALRDGATLDLHPFEVVVHIGRAGGPSAPPEAHLEIIDGPGTGMRFVLQGEAMGIGRADDQHIRLPDQGASRSHAMVVRRGAGWQIRDNHSINGTLVNGERQAEAVLRPGDIVSIGNTRLRYHVSGAPETSPVEELAAPRSPVEISDDPPGARTAPHPIAGRPPTTPPAAPSAPASTQEPLLLGILATLTLAVLAVGIYLFMRPAG